MLAPVPEPVCLERRDPAQNMARFYVLALQYTLFGETSLIQNWGRIGAWGQVRTETFCDAEAALAAARSIERVKTRRGYRRVASTAAPRP
ncbi:WGR domain-containing protein [Defluviimonas salinarum]|uniref:WGR domain-containing protein n=1 Tax=Defluviimonas salinarum TaxID=2992147 RepID=A0ABT3J848_9RHOB|nr:WGR domain-containing protein [Defluviimonas salinarum]MCW3783867.1 WGR domain-containing protein [Defluviimonas salinarum]